MTKFLMRQLLVCAAFIFAGLISSVSQAEFSPPSTESLGLIRDLFNAHMQSSLPDHKASITSEVLLSPLKLPKEVQKRITINFPKFSSHLARDQDFRISFIEYTACLDDLGVPRQAIYARLINDNEAASFDLKNIWGRSEIDGLFPQYKSLFEEIYNELSRLALGSCEVALASPESHS